MLKKPRKPRRASESTDSGTKRKTRASNAKATDSVSEGAARNRKTFVPIQPMLASVAAEPFSKEGWIFEPKLDGIRAMAYIENHEAKIISRKGLDLTKRYPQLVTALSENEDMIIDGEIVATDESGRVSFRLLQKTAGSRGAAGQARICFYAFDILSFQKKNTMKNTFLQRRALLEKNFFETEKTRCVQDLGPDGNRAFLACLADGMEGVIAKRADSKYLPGERTDAWLKLVATRTTEFLVCGYTEANDGRTDSFGALILGVYNESGQIVYAGSVGTGFNEITRQKLFRLMEPHKTSECPFSVRPMAKSIAAWVTPDMIVEIKYAEWTMDKALNLPVFLQVRANRKSDGMKPDVVIPISEVSSVGQPAKKSSAKTTKPAKVVSINRKRKTRKVDKAEELRKSLLEQLNNDEDDMVLEVEGSSIKLSSLNKILFPGKRGTPAGTKRDYINYLIQASEPFLRQIHGRPFTLIRYPDGAQGQKFFQKHWSQGLPEFVETVEYFSEHADKDEEYLLCNNLATLIWCGQLASLELHSVHGRIDPEPDGAKLSKKLTGSISNIESSILNFPDFMVLDLDPYLYSGKEAANAEPELHRQGFAKTRQLAHLLKEMLDNLGLNAFLKTSGKTGLHIYIPIIRNVDNDAVRQLIGTIASHVAKMRPQDVTVEWAVKKRTGKVFFDFNMNARHKTLSAPYSVRATNAGNVSLPISWDELDDIYPTDFDIRTVPARLEQVGDLWENILNEKTDLHKILLK